MRFWSKILLEFDANLTLRSACRIKLIGLMHYDEAIRARIERAAAARGWTLAEVLRRAGLHRTTLARSPLHGHRSDVIRRIGNVLGWSDVEAAVIFAAPRATPFHRLNERLTLIANLAAHMYVYIQDGPLDPPETADELLHLTKAIMELSAPASPAKAASAGPDSAAGK
jgi:hypothetical protein